MKATKAVKKGSSGRPIFLYKLVAVLLPVVFLLVIEGLLRITGYGDNLKLFIKSPIEGYEKYMMVNPEIGKKYFQKLEYTSPANDIFLRDKPANTFRIFVMGSSVVYGFPYDRNIMFSRILHKQLEDAYPEKKFEVVNTSITAINSFTLLDFIDQILKYSPDAILIYEGHNEFYGAFGIGSNEAMSRNRALARVHITMMDSRLYQLFRNIIAGISKGLAGKKAERSQGTLMKRIVANADILLNSEEYHITMERFTQNMGDILKMAGRKNIPVFFSELVSNINGMEPFNSISNDTLESAIDVYNQAKEAEENHDYEQAHALYFKAKDLDCLRFRASEDINAIVRQLSEAHGAYLVPMLAQFQNHSPEKLIGNNLMTEHVHPNIEGSLLMADAFFSSMVESAILGERNIYHKELSYYRYTWGYTELDRLLAHHRIQSLKGFWPFVSEGKEGYDYSGTYRPRSYLDSLAFSVMKNPNLNLSEVRLKLAERYEKAGRIHQAYREYEALVRMNPYIAVNYRDAARCLLQLNDLPLALTYLHQSLEYEESFFAKFRIAEIYLIMGDYENAIRYFNESFYIAPEDSKVNVLGKSYVALVYANNVERAKVVAAELERIKATQYLRVPPKQYLFDEYIPFQTQDKVAAAKELISQDKQDEALAMLEASLKVYDSHIAHRMAGDIYFEQQNNEKAYYHLYRVYDLFRFDPQFLHKFILLNMAMNDAGNARKYLNELMQLDPAYPPLGVLTMMLSQ